MRKGKSVMKKMLSLTLPFVLVAAIVMTLPQASMQVQAASDVKDVNLGIGGIKWPEQPTNNSTPWQGSKVYFGTDPESTKNLWMVLDPDNGLLLANGSVADRRYDDNSNKWEDSELREWLNGNYYKSTKFSALEQEAILNEIGLLQRSSACTSKYGFEAEKTRSQSRVTDGIEWWVYTYNRSLNCLPVVGSDGSVSNSDYIVNKSFGVRPAFNLNLSSVLFTSAAVGGKSATVVSALTQVATYGGDEWKLTLKDTARNGFDTSFSAKTETKLFINYTGAQEGNNEYISAVVEDAGKITHYAKLKEVNGSASGSVEIDLSSIPTSSTLKIFNEQDNGDQKTDYASELKEVTIPADADAYDLTATLTNLTNEGTPYVKKGGDYTTKLIPDTGYTYPASINVKADGNELTEGEDNGFTYNPATGEVVINSVALTGNIEIIAAGVLAPTGGGNTGCGGTSGGGSTPSGGSNTGCGGTSGGGSTPSGGSNTQVSQGKIDHPNPFVVFLQKTIEQIAGAKEGATITIDFGDFNVLTLPVMKQMAMRRDLTIQMKYRYKGQKYEVTFPAGMPINYQDDIRYYGPLKLSDMANRDGGKCSIK